RPVRRQRQADRRRHHLPDSALGCGHRGKRGTGPGPEPGTAPARPEHGTRRAWRGPAHQRGEGRLSLPQRRRGAPSHHHARPDGDALNRLPDAGHPLAQRNCRDGESESATPAVGQHPLAPYGDVGTRLGRVGDPSPRSITFHSANQLRPWQNRWHYSPTPPRYLAKGIVVDEWHSPRHCDAPLGLSGVDKVRVPELCGETLQKIYEMLPVKRSSPQRLASEISALGARYHRYLHQDEFGPTRAECMAALGVMQTRVGLLDSLIGDLPQHLALELTYGSAESDQSLSFQVLRSRTVLRGWTLEQIHEAASTELGLRSSLHTADDLGMLQEICARAAAAMEVVSLLDTD